MINKLVFPINNYDRIELQIPSKETDIYRYDEIKIVLNCHLGSYTLYSDDFIIEAIRTLQNLLEKALNNELEVPDSLSELEIGKLSNDNYQDILIYEGKHWGGEKYNVWNTNGFETWLYNKMEEIYIQVTPLYKWHFNEPENMNNFSSYSQFVRDYEIIYKAEIETDIAIQWLNKCKEIIRIISRND
ncbi:hypothetical protein HCJ40_02135 [Listeria sp. FSL L7-0993]|uniref:hypothetical protein n=1 Tax=Listeria cossartiae TaxID=2838249 RepID=UPI0016262F91|nr:hypothetical protein [Listeria cossartiae]MBC1805819.1 hypothetical protein [Listeria cossartiae subsp. cayugensis]